MKIAAKPLQMETTFRKSLPPYPLVPSLTFYNLPLTHNTAWLAYHSALLPLKVMISQCQWLISHLKASMRLPIGNQ